MIPLFSPSCELVGWLEPGEHIFNTDMGWGAYITQSHVWSARTGNWLGPILDNNCLDHTGKVVAFSEEGPVQNMMAAPLRPVRAVRAVRPVRPVRPVSPIRPIRPVRPLGGWSSLPWEAWMRQ